MSKRDAGTLAALRAQQWVPSFPMMIDKTAGSWVITGHLDDGNEGGMDVTLRLRIRRCELEPEDRMFFDVRVGATGEFIQLGEGVPCCACGAGFEESATFVTDTVEAGRWAEQFKEMARRWAVMSMVLEPGDAFEVLSTSERESSTEGAKP